MKIKELIINIIKLEICPNPSDLKPIEELWITSTKK